MKAAFIFSAGEVVVAAAVPMKDGLVLFISDRTYVPTTYTRVHERSYACVSINNNGNNNNNSSDNCKICLTCLPQRTWNAGFAHRDKGESGSTERSLCVCDPLHTFTFLNGWIQFVRSSLGSSVTRWLDYLFNIWPFTKMKICPISQSRF